MASDYGDEAGEKLFDNMMRFGERMGEQAMYRRANQMQRAFDNARNASKQQANDASLPVEEPSEWAKLDMAEFRDIEDYDGIKEIIEAKLKTHGVDSTWFLDAENNKEYLLFRIVDAQEVWQSFDELSHETQDACEKAAECLSKAKDKVNVRDERPLDERAEQAREASKALEAERSATKAHSREPRLEQARAK